MPTTPRAADQPAPDPLPPWEAPFVLAIPEPDAARVGRERGGRSDRYSMDGDDPRPLVVLVHGGPIPDDLPASPRDWPTYRGYATAAALRGCVGLVIDHPLHGFDRYDDAWQVVTDEIDAARADSRVDADRVAIWVFSGGGPFLSRLLEAPPAHIRVIAATYPILVDRPGRRLPTGFHPLEVIDGLDPATAALVPGIVLTSVGHEETLAAAGAEAFAERGADAGLRIQRIHVAAGFHGFDSQQPTPEAIDAVRRAIEAVTAALGDSAPARG